MFELVIWCRLFISLLVLVYKFDHMPLLPKSRKILTCSVKIVKNYKKKKINVSLIQVLKKFCL